MNRSSGYFMALLFAAGVLRGAERDVVRAFDVNAGCELDIRTFDGSIDVRESDNRQIRVAVHVEIGGTSSADSDRLLRRFHLNFSRTGDRVSVVASDRSKSGFRLAWNDSRQVEPTFRVSVPRRCNLRLETGRGSVIVGDIVGTLSARTDTGDVFLRHTGGTVSAVARDGNVVISQCDGAAYGQVSHGTIRFGVMNGPCQARNASGGIEVMAARAGIDAYAVAGDVVVGLPRDISGKAELRASGGNVVVKIDPVAHCNLHVSTGWFCHVDCRLPVAVRSGGLERRSLVAYLNGGGVQVDAYASGGNVMLEPGGSPFE